MLAFWQARLEEDQAAAWAVHDVSKCDALLYEEDMADAARRDPGCDCGRPARVLRDVQAQRAVLDLCVRALRFPANAPLASLSRRVIACSVAAWSGHPDYRAEWTA